MNVLFGKQGAFCKHQIVLHDNFGGLSLMLLHSAQKTGTSWASWSWATSVPPGIYMPFQEEKVPDDV
ncbi:hypothetical protein HPB49_010028 [Dermacentor silvarum]|uniref:Uncharacterized protein n=1 Tax=Dermacentor silvarum TaxID=543639 RepID=A0ACB8DCE5_DERSI|nr:hypothetical protein HPB49_010028 [Dermacentor silvarum]